MIEIEDVSSVSVRNVAGNSHFVSTPQCNSDRNHRIEYDASGPPNCNRPAEVIVLLGPEIDLLIHCPDVDSLFVTFPFHFLYIYIFQSRTPIRYDNNE